MAISWQIPRNCLIWLLLSQFVLLLPHVQRLPWWVLLVYGCCTVWRIMVYQGRWSLPPGYVKFALAVLSFGGIYQSYGTVVGLEATVALLFAGFSLKLFEIGTRRDVYLLIYLAYFVAATAFLFSQTLLLSLYLLFCLLVITSALVALHQHGFGAFSLGSLRKAAIIFSQAIPLMIILFLVFPRFQPLWSVPLPSSEGKTGMSDTMSPGDISRLGRSDALVFRVVFDGRIPDQSRLYWRGLVLSQFDGRRWRPGRSGMHWMSPQAQNQVKDGFEHPIRYHIIQEPSDHNWTYTLAVAYSASPLLRMVSDYRLITLDPIRSRIQYDVVSDTGAVKGLHLTAHEQHFYTKLPVRGNKRSRQFAQQLRLASSSEPSYIERVLTFFATQKFYYTLEPPVLGANPVDEFLFQTRRGFCEHFASSFVFLMRAAGIPARVVVGYQGGEVNPLDNTVTVRQYDAHAWAEVWLSGKGWIRFDPTAAVSPLRIESGLESALAQNREPFLADSLLSPYRYRNIRWLNRLRLHLEAINYYWTSWILDYQGQRQLDVLGDILGKVNSTRIAILLISVGLVMFGVISWPLLKVRRLLKPEQRLYLDMCRRLSRAGFERKSSEGPIDYARRVASQNPSWKPGLLAATRAYIKLSFEPLSDTQRKRVYRQFRAEVFRLRYRLRMG